MRISKIFFFCTHFDEQTNSISAYDWELSFWFKRLKFFNQTQLFLDEKFVQKHHLLLQIPLHSLILDLGDETSNDLRNLSSQGDIV